MSIKFEYKREDITILSETSNDDISLGDIVDQFRNFLWDVGYFFDDLEIIEKGENDAVQGNTNSVNRALRGEDDE